MFHIELTRKGLKMKRVIALVEISFWFRFRFFIHKF